jgi:hypothetical protein
MGTTVNELSSRLSSSLGARPVADVTLEWVILRHGAAGGCVLALRSDGETVPFMTRDVPLTKLVRAQKLGRDNATRLAAGQELAGPDYLLVPVLDAAAQLLGFLYLDSPRVASGTAFIGVYSVVFANCLTARSVDPSPALAQYLGSLTPRDEDRNRERLVLSLNRFEWNIARVARDLGVARRTIYLWLARYGIERKRIPKTAGRNPQPA